MKSYIFCVAIFAFWSFSSEGAAQPIQWASLKPGQKHLLNLHAGVEYGLVAGVGYGRILNTKHPVVLTAGYSFPFGKNLADDFKTNIGGHIQWIQLGNFQLTTKLQGSFRRHETSYIRLLNAGFDVSAAVGFYRPKWFAAAEAGFDKAIATNFRHSAVFKENYPGVRDGWYGPATSEHFYYGLQSGFSFKKQDMYLKAGSMLEADFKTRPFLPFYLEMGINRRL